MENSIRAACKELEELLIRKNDKYGNSFKKTADQYGKAVLLLRIEDKLNRLKQLTLYEKAEDKDESILDTFIDIAGYGILAKIYLENKGD